MEDGFPFEGSQASQIMCLTCGFKSKAAVSTFCSLTLSVPEVPSTTLDFCLDQLFKVEHIDEFKCEKCRLIHALDNFQHELSKSTSEAFRRRTTATIEKLQNAIDTDPEQKLEGVELPDMKFAPKRKIEKSAKIINFPKVLAIHLSRSVFGLGSTTKNSAKVVFPERWRVGGVQSFRWYRLSSVVCHKGSHQSGHYETFRRQSVAQPFSNVNTFQPAPVYSKPPTPVPSRISTPQVEALQNFSLLLQRHHHLFRYRIPMAALQGKRSKTAKIGHCLFQHPNLPQQVPPLKVRLQLPRIQKLAASALWHDLPAQHYQK
jgi:ubiquitin carboxyl-terminal hydrolase 16